jgi:small-conductance mechanosensitive channel
VRTSIVLWSTLSGTILGLFADALLIGLALLVSPLISAGISARLHSRSLVVAATIVLAAIPLVLSVLGYLEGDLKSV